MERNEGIDRLFRAQELCVKIEVAVPGSPSLIVLTILADVQKH